MPVVGPPMGHPGQNMGFYPNGGMAPPTPQPNHFHGNPHGFMPPPQQPPQVSDHIESAKKRQDYEALCHIINQWNANRLDLFALTLPNEVRNKIFFSTGQKTRCSAYLK